MEQGHATVPHVLVGQAEVGGHSESHSTQLHVVVQNAFWQPGRPRGVNDHEVGFGSDRHVRCREFALGRSDFPIQACNVIPLRGDRTALGAENQNVFLSKRAQLSANALDLGKKLFIDHQHTRACVIEHSCQYFPSQSGVDPEQRKARKRTPSVQRQQFQVVFEQHGDMTRMVAVDLANPLQQKVRRAHAFVAELPIRPAPVAVHEHHLVSRDGMTRPGLDVGAHSEARCVEDEWFSHSQSCLQFQRNE